MKFRISTAGQTWDIEAESETGALKVAWKESPPLRMGQAVCCQQLDAKGQPVRGTRKYMWWEGALEIAGIDPNNYLGRR